MLGDSDEFEADLSGFADLTPYPACWPAGDATEPDLGDDAGEWADADGSLFSAFFAAGIILGAGLVGLLVVAVLRAAFAHW